MASSTALILSSARSIDWDSGTSGSPLSDELPRSSSFRREKARLPALRRFAAGLAVAALIAAPGCVHLVEPVEPAALVRAEDEDVTSFAPGTRIVLENLRTESEIVRVRREGVHVLEVDLRDWSDRLLDALAVELERLGAEVRFGDASTRAYPEPRLRLDLTHMEFPRRDGSGNAVLIAQVSSLPDGYARRLASRGAATFTEAYQQVVRGVADDPRLREWLATRTE